MEIAGQPMGTFVTVSYPTTMRLAPLVTAAAAVFVAAPTAQAHAIAGNRFFPATIASDDPGVADELSLPVVSEFRPGDETALREMDVQGEWAKRLTRNLGISVADGWTRLSGSDGQTTSGFQNLEATLKYQALTSPAHEAIVAAGVSYELGGSGAASVGAERHSTITPTIYFGKGAGDLPDTLDWARPFALTGVVSYSIPSRSHEGGERLPDVLGWGGALEYSLPYLAAHVRDLGLPEFVNQLTPVIEASFERPVTRVAAPRTTGTVNPGVIWSGDHFQVAAEAALPINRASGRGVGVKVQVHFFLDDLLPHSIGKPIW